MPIKIKIPRVQCIASYIYCKPQCFETSMQYKKNLIWEFLGHCKILSPHDDLKRPSIFGQAVLGQIKKLQAPLVLPWKQFRKKVDWLGQEMQSIFYPKLCKNLLNRYSKLCYFDHLTCTKSVPKHDKRTCKNARKTVELHAWISRWITTPSRGVKAYNRGNPGATSFDVV